VCLKHIQNIHDFRENIKEQHAGWQRLMQQQRSLDEDQRSLSTKSGEAQKKNNWLVEIVATCKVEKQLLRPR